MVFSSIHDAIAAYNGIVGNSVYGRDNIYYGRDECASAPSHYLLDHSEPRQAVQKEAKPVATIDPVLTIKRIQETTASWLNSIVGKHKIESDNGSLSQTRQISPQLIKFKKRRGPDGESYVISHPRTLSNQSKHTVLAEKSANPLIRPARPENPCKFCGIRHWFAGPQSTPCARHGSDQKRFRSREKEPRIRSGSRAASDKENSEYHD